MNQSIAIDPERFASIPELDGGAHEPDQGAMCVMEAVAYVAGEPWTDRPQCACPVIASFCRAWNDSMNGEDRERLLRPMIPRLVGTRGSDELAQRRSLMAADWLVRVHTPEWLRLAGLVQQADALAGLSEITDMAQVPSIKPAIEAARADASAARDAAWSAAWSSARDAAWAAAWSATGAAAGSAAGSAAWSAAGDAAWSAARDAAWAAAGSAAGAALRPTLVKLQESARDLLERMIAAEEA